MNEKRSIYNLVFGLLFILVIIPVIQQVTGFSKVTALKGHFTEVKKPSFIFDNFWNGIYQDSLNKYVEENIGFRPNLIRIHNTVNYYAYKKINTGKVIIGKENYAFEQVYIDATLGQDYVGIEKIKEKTRKAAFIQQYFQKKGIEFIYLFAPGKGTYFREYIPEVFKLDSITTTNYKKYIEEFENHNISYIDFNEWFLKMKDTTAYPLFPQYGIHWSRYGMILAFDSLVQYLEYHTGNDLANLNWDSVEVSDQLRGTDYDLGKALNLLWNLPTFSMGYPKLYWEKRFDKVKPDMVSISDSFFWNWYAQGLTDSVFNKTDFLYYFRKYYSSEFEGVGDFESLQLIPFLEDHDVIIIMYTDGNLKNYAYKFIDRVYDHLSNENSKTINFHFIDNENVSYDCLTGVYSIWKDIQQNRVFLQCNKFPIKIKPDASYKISYKAKGHNAMRIEINAINDKAAFSSTRIGRHIHGFLKQAVK
jgi:hypothetical protein